MSHTNKVSIRKAQSFELETISRLYENTIDHMDKTINYTGWKIGFYPTYDVAKSAFDEGTLYIATVCDKIAGTCVLNHAQPEQYAQVNWQIDTDKILCVHTLAINPEFSRQGIAQALLAFADELAIIQDIHSIRLDTSKINLPAISLYEKAGYKKTGMIDLKIERTGIKCWYTFEKII